MHPTVLFDFFLKIMAWCLFLSALIPNESIGNDTWSAFTHCITSVVLTLIPSPVLESRSLGWRAKNVTDHSTVEWVFQELLEKVKIPNTHMDDFEVIRTFYYVDFYN